MDKWEETVERIKNGMLAEEPEAALAGALELFANFGRTLELISADTDRIATALERQDVEITGEDQGIPPELRHDEPDLEHDL
jgi:hypothetical protein